MRWEVLRKPWNKEQGSEKDELEDQSVHAMICDDKGSTLAVCRLHFINGSEGQVRYMAVRADQQGKGLGKMIVAYIEERAKEKGMKRIILHARENAVDFYKSCNYIVKEKSHLLWGKIQHWLMEKSI